MAHKSNNHRLISEYLEDYHHSGKFISPKLFRGLQGEGLTQYVSNLPGKSKEEDISMALGKYDAFLAQRASHQATTKSESEKLKPTLPPPAEIIESKLTKKAVSEFLVWSTTSYNDYLGYGTKKDNVEKVYKSLIEGHYNGANEFLVQCASSIGENISKKRNRYWRTKGKGGDDYTVNCVEKTIFAKYRNQLIRFD